MNYHLEREPRKITFCLMTCGEETEAECLKAIEPFRDRIDYCEVRNVYPQITALNYMIDQIWTEFFVPLDADMILDKRTYAVLEVALQQHSEKDWHTILFPLYDTLTDRRILGLKLMRTEIMKKHRFVESATPDVEHHTRLGNEGYRCITDYLGIPTVGKHVVCGRRFCYSKYKDVYLTYRSHGKVWDGGVFMGGKNLKDLSKAHFDFFFYRWAMTGNWDYLHCIAGMVDGLISQVSHESKSLKPEGYGVKSNEAPMRYMKWHDQQKPDLAEMLF